MGLYKYTALSGSGKTVRGMLHADSLASFYAELKRGDLYCLNVKDISGNPSLFSKLFGKTALPRAEVAVFCRQMASMTASGVTINRCLDVLYAQCGHPRMKLALSQLYGEVQKGNQLSSAMSGTGGAFEPLVINMVRAGENSGTLDRSLARLAGHYERDIKLRNKTALALLYPAILAAASLIIIMILFVVVLPSFITMFQSLENLPWYTRALMSFSDFIARRWYIVVALAAMAAAGVAALRQNEDFMLRFDTAALKLPVTGKLQTRIVCARFCRVFASLYSSGMQILDALELSGGVVGNRCIRASIKRASERIKTGMSLAFALQRENLFPPMMITMLTVGEESGELDKMLEKTSEYYDDEADSAAQKLIGMLQPVMILILGILVAFVMIAVLKPIYTMYSNF